MHKNKHTYHQTLQEMQSETARDIISHSNDYCQTQKITSGKVGRTENDVAIIKNASSSESVKNHHTTQESHFWRYIPKYRTRGPQNRCLYIHVPSSTVSNSQSGAAQVHRCAGANSDFCQRCGMRSDSLMRTNFCRMKNICGVTVGQK